MRNVLHQVQGDCEILISASIVDQFDKWGWRVSPMLYINGERAFLCYPPLGRLDDVGNFLHMELRGMMSITPRLKTEGLAQPATKVVQGAS